MFWRKATFSRTDPVPTSVFWLVRYRSREGGTRLAPRWKRILAIDCQEPHKLGLMRALVIWQSRDNILTR
jgi:hypothetical protein